MAGNPLNIMRINACMAASLQEWNTRTKKKHEKNIATFVGATRLNSVYSGNVVPLLFILPLLSRL